MRTLVPRTLVGVDASVPIDHQNYELQSAAVTAVTVAKEKEERESQDRLIFILSLLGFAMSAIQFLDSQSSKK